MIEFTIPGEPTGKARPVVTKTGAFTPKKTVLYENLVKTVYSGEILDGFLEANIKAYYAIPKSKPKNKKELMKQGVIRPDKKPDCDNVAKIILDALNGIAYADDKQVVRLTVEKWYSDKPRVEVVLSSVLGRCVFNDH
ncbi:MAG TPA: RusA family crossover junction endodeoxyribonuclease [Lachnospiraceae bacterium]|nr:RusA family crossover junction endodeoxyribonuclease [Lachnospiraceae bacterium]